MAIQIRLTDNADRIQTRLSGNKHAALTAMGLKGVELTVNQMQTGYGRPIWQTGDLQRDVSFEVENSGKNTVDVGNSLEYGPYVHEGTYKMGARPYLRDALMGGRDELKQVVEEQLKNGF